MNDIEKLDLIMTGRPDMPEDCWKFPGARITEGRSRVWFNGKMQTLSRLVWTLHFGDIPSDHVIRSECGDSRCYNPKHLRMVTQEAFTKERFEEFRPVFEARETPSAYTYFYNLAFLQASPDDRISYSGLRLTLDEFTARWQPGRGIGSGLFDYADEMV